MSNAMRAAIPTLQPGIDDIPTWCTACGSSLLSVSAAGGGERFGSLSCGTCSREIAWLHEPVRTRPFPESTGERTAEAEASTSVSPEPWRRLACTSDCRRERVIVVSGNGSTRPQWREYHEITAHDDHATYLLLALGSLLHQQIVEAARPKPFPVTPGPPIVRTGPLVVDRPARRATVNGAEVRLTEAEHLILETLCAGFGAIVPRETVRQAVWPDAIARNGSGKRVKGDSFKVLRTLLNRLREKLGPAGALIDTFSGRGFLLRDEPISEGTGGGP